MRRLLLLKKDIPTFRKKILRRHGSSNVGYVFDDHDLKLIDYTWEYILERKISLLKREFNKDGRISIPDHTSPGDEGIRLLCWSYVLRLRLLRLDNPFKSDDFNIEIDGFGRVNVSKWFIEKKSELKQILHKKAFTDFFDAYCLEKNKQKTRALSFNKNREVFADLTIALFIASFLDVDTQYKINVFFSQSVIELLHEIQVTEEEKLTFDLETIEQLNIPIYPLNLTMEHRYAVYCIKIGYNEFNVGFVGGRTPKSTTGTKPETLNKRLTTHRTGTEHELLFAIALRSWREVRDFEGFLKMILSRRSIAINDKTEQYRITDPEIIDEIMEHYCSLAPDRAKLIEEVYISSYNYWVRGKNKF